MAALFICRRSCRELKARRAKRFTIKEIEPFLFVEYRQEASAGGSFCAILGVAIQKENGAWGVHELSDEADAGRSQPLCTSPALMEKLKCRAAAQMKKRLVEALNRLRDHYERVYIYPARGSKG